MDMISVRYAIRQKMAYGPTPNETWYGRIIEDGEKPCEISLKTKDKNVAKGWLDEQNAIYLLYCNAIKRGQVPDALPLTRRSLKVKSNQTSVSLEDAVDAFLKYKESNEADPKTIKLYRMRFDKMIGFCKERSINRLKDFNVKAVQDFWSTLSNQSAKSKYCIRSAGKLLFEWAIQRYSITSILNPFLSIDKPKVKTKEAKIWNADEIQAILDNAPDVEWRAFFAVAAFTGGRDNEIFSLLTEDYDAEAKTIHYHVGVKFRKERTVHVPDQLAKYLGDYLDSVLDKSGNLFKHISAYNGMRNDKLRKVAKAAGIVKDEADLKDVKMHRFRHSVTTAMVANGCDLKAVAQTLGHQNPSTTLSVYTHTVNDETLAATTNSLWQNKN